MESHPVTGSMLVGPFTYVVSLMVPPVGTH